MTNEQIERLVPNTAGMYGAICGVIGVALPEIQALELGALPEPDEPT